MIHNELSPTVQQDSNGELLIYNQRQENTPVFLRIIGIVFISLPMMVEINTLLDERYRWQKDGVWEQYERGIHRVVTVRTIETSDDNNHEAITDSDSVWFKISSDGGRIACYYSPDGETWQMVRLYKNNYPEKLFIGISSQGPGEDAFISQFKKLSLTYGSVGNFRLGE